MSEVEPEVAVLLLAGRFEVRGRSTYTVRLATGLPAVGMSGRIATPDARVILPVDRMGLNIREYPRL